MKSENSFSIQTTVSFLVLSLFSVFLLFVFAAKDSFLTPFSGVVVKTEFLGTQGQVLEQFSETSFLGKPHLPQGTYAVRFYLDKKALDATINQYSLLLSPMENALRIRVDGTIVQEFGSFSKGTSPRLREYVFNHSDYDIKRDVAIEMRVSSLAGRDFEFFKSSGLADSKRVAYLGFFRAFANYYGYLGLSAVFLTIFLFVLIVGLNAGLVKQALPQAISFLCQSWVSLYFSRFYFELPDYVWFYRVSFVVYVAGFGFFLWYLSSELTRSVVREALRYLSWIFIGLAGILLVSSTQLEFLKLVDLYKSFLLALGVTAIAVWGLLFVYFRKTPGRDGTRQLGLLASTAIIMMGYVLDVLRSFGYSLFLYNVGPYAYLIGFLILLAVFVSRINGQYQVALSQERDAAVARTTQMLAHDVRKPFSMLQMIVEMIHDAKSIDEIQDVAARSLPELERAMSSVNGLIQDVMEISSQSKPVLEDTKVESVLLHVLDDTFRVVPQTNVGIVYHLKHETQIKVHTSKLFRVFSNILHNALQAMSYDGLIWIKTRNLYSSSGGSFVEFTIGNGGSFVAKNDIPYLFDAFFTKGKKGGTGLGLAIAKKIVTDHGGTVTCVSGKDRTYPDGFVEFIFTVPASSLNSPPFLNDLPKSSKELTESYTRWFHGQRPNKLLSTGKDDATLEKELTWQLHSLEEPLRVLIVDDESIYRNALASQLQKSSGLNQYIHLEFATSSSECFALVKKSKPFHLIIMDVDLGENSLNGFECVQSLRAAQVGAFICVHSNRMLANDNKQAIELGANAFLPKPLSRSHFLKLIIQSCESMLTPSSNSLELKPVEWESSASDLATRSKSTASPVHSDSHLSSKKTFVFVDDSEIARSHWEKKWPSDFGNLITFSSPEGFLSWLEQSSEPSRQSLAAVFTDLNFDHSSTFDGHLLALEVRNRLKIPVFLTSHSTFAQNPPGTAWNRSLPKNPPSLEELVQLMV